MIEPYESERQCQRCGQCKPKSMFSPSKCGKDGLHSYCKPCRSEYVTAAKKAKRLKPARAKAADREEIWPRPITEQLLDLKLRNFRYPVTAGQLTWRV